MSEFSNKLTDAEAERLALLLEEMGEAQQAIGKILRHGYESGWNGSNNREDLEVEVGHVLLAVEMLTDAGDLREREVLISQGDKREDVKPFLHHQPNQANQRSEG